MLSANGCGQIAFGSARTRPPKVGWREVGARYGKSYAPFSYVVIQWVAVAFLPMVPL